MDLNGVYNFINKLDMKNFKILLLIALILCSCQKNEYKITINVPNEFNDATAYLVQQIGRDITFTDSTIVTESVAHFVGKQDSVVYRTIILKQNDQRTFISPIVLEKGETAVTYLDEKSTISGTSTNNILQKYLQIEQHYNPIFEELLTSYFKTEENEVEKRHMIETQYDILEQEFNQKVLAFINENLNNVAGAYAFGQIYRSLSEEEQMSLIDNAGESFLSQPDIAQIANRIKQIKGTIGNKFPDMQMKNPQGEEVRLSDFAGKGKYIVIDFWASWCGPCRRAMPELISIYNEYKDKGVDVVGVSFDNDEQAWKSSIESLGLPWHQMSDLKGWESIATSIYGVNSIPHLMLLDPEGIIIAKKLNDNTLRQKLQEIFK